MKLNRLILPLAIGAAVIAPGLANAAIITWGGGSGEWNTDANWIGGTKPTPSTGDTAIINAGDVTYTPGGDLTFASGGTLQLNGGSWTQVTGGAWIQLGAGGFINVAGGTFNQGSAGNINKNAAGTFNISAGVANFNGNYVLDAGFFNLTGGIANVANEFKPVGGTGSISGGTLNANLISFNGVATSLAFSGGTISLQNNGDFTIYHAGTGFLDFTTNSTGTLRVENYTLAQANALFAQGKIGYGGVVDLTGTNFSISEVLDNDDAVNDVVITALVPEPSVVMLGALGLLAAGFRRNRKA